MFRDTKEELKRLEEELLAQEEQDQQPDPPAQPVYRNFSNHYGADLRNYASGYKAYNTDRTDTDPQQLSNQIRGEEEEKPLTGLVLTACALTLGILLVMLYWAVKLLGA